MTRRRKRRRKRSRRKRGSKLQCKLPQQWSRVVLVTKGNCFIPVNKEEEKEKEEAEEKVEEEDKMRTRMQSSIAVQQSCTRGPRRLFLSSE